MATKALTKAKRRRTIEVPVKTMEEVPLLSQNERDVLLASLVRAHARVKAGKAVDHDSKTFKNRLMSIYRGGKRWR
jgi:hypothetical protein